MPNLKQTLSCLMSRDKLSGPLTVHENEKYFEKSQVSFLFPDGTVRDLSNFITIGEWIKKYTGRSKETKGCGNGRTFIRTGRIPEGSYILVPELGIGLVEDRYFERIPTGFKRRPPTKEVAEKFGFKQGRKKKNTDAPIVAKGVSLNKDGTPRKKWIAKNERKPRKEKEAIHE